jgi:YbbR domain-containing protein
LGLTQDNPNSKRVNQSSHGGHSDGSSNVDMNTNKISIKIMGSETQVLNTLDKIESVFPLSIRSKVMPNDDGENFHVWLTVAVEAVRQDQPRQAAAPQLSFNLTGATSK